MSDEPLGELPSKIVADAERQRAQSIQQLTDLDEHKLFLTNVTRETLLDTIGQYETVMRHYGWKTSPYRNKRPIRVSLQKCRCICRDSDRHRDHENVIDVNRTRLHGCGD